MSQKTSIGLIVALNLLLTLPAAAEVASPAMLANTCAGCHGTDGQSSDTAVPTIAGLNADYSVKIMQDYQDGTAASTIMGRIVKGYTDADLQAMADYFAKIPFIGQVQPHDPKLAQEGALLHNQYCEACHGGNGKDAGYGGILAAQRMQYLRFTLADFQSGTRDMPGPMRKNLLRVGDKGIEALIHFYGSQK